MYDLVSEELQTLFVTVSFTRNQLIALGSSAVVVVVGIGSYLVSVRNQNCASYERQLISNIKDGNKLLEQSRAQYIKKFEINDLATDMETINFRAGQEEKESQNYRSWNNIRYSYLKTCGGSGRYEKWASTPEVKPLLDADGSLRDEIDKIKKADESQDVEDMRQNERQYQEAMRQFNNL